MRKRIISVLNLSSSSDTVREVEGILTTAGAYEVLTSTIGQSNERLLLPRPDVLIIISIHSAREFFREFPASEKKYPAFPPVLLVTGESALQHGAGFNHTCIADFLTVPFKPVELLARIRRLLDESEEIEHVTQSLKEKLGLKQLIGESPKFLAQVNRIPPFAKCNASVLIVGETGTGKEVFARAIHYLSSRSGGPFISVNCGAIPVELVENELFGHEQGAYTGAATSKTGLVREAHSGTLLLDEINCLPLSAQVKLLRFLENKEYHPVGSSKSQRADVRIISASNADLTHLVREGNFRSDLFYRIQTLELNLPPLRERTGDVDLLAAYFLRVCPEQHEKAITGFSPWARYLLNVYDWPGNVRELRNVVERSLVFTEEGLIHARAIEFPKDRVLDESLPMKQMKEKVVEEFEKGYLTRLLALHDGNIARAALAANKNRRAFFELLKKHEIAIPKP